MVACISPDFLVNSKVNTLFVANKRLRFYPWTDTLLKDIYETLKYIHINLTLRLLVTEDDSTSTTNPTSSSLENEKIEKPEEERVK